MTTPAAVVAPSTLTSLQNVALRKMEDLIAAGRERAHRGLEVLNREWHIRRDRMVRAGDVDVRVENRKLHLVVADEALGLTEHARGQLLERALIPARFAETLVDRDLGELLRTNVRSLLPKANTSLLVRDVDQTVKGVLSSSYRRMDAAPVFDAFIRTCLEAGLFPHDGTVTDTRAFCSFLYPEVVDLGAGEYVVLGLELRASDYGRGALEVVLVVIRLLCVNGMMGTDVFRKVHLQRRFDGTFDEGGIIDLSARTVTLDLATLKSAVADAVRGAKRFTTTLVEMLKAKVVDSSKADMTALLGSLRKRGFKQELVDRVKATYEAEMPVESLPQAPNLWRFSNTLSLLAHGAAGDEKKDLQDMAWQVVLPEKFKQ